MLKRLEADDGIDGLSEASTGIVGFEIGLDEAGAVATESRPRCGDRPRADVDPNRNFSGTGEFGSSVATPHAASSTTEGRRALRYSAAKRYRPRCSALTDTGQDALSRMFALPSSHYSDPEFSWKFVLAPAAMGFVAGGGLGSQFEGDLFVGFSTLDRLGGPLFRFNLTGNRRKLAVADPRLDDRVADNLTFHDMMESESLLVGRDFGIVTDIETGPNGHLFVVSL